MLECNKYPTLNRGDRWCSLGWDHIQGVCVCVCVMGRGCWADGIWRCELKYSSVLMIQQMGLWFAKTKGVKRDKQTVTTDKQQGVRRVTVGTSVYAFLLQTHINHPLRKKSSRFRALSNASDSLMHCGGGGGDQMGKYVWALMCSCYAVVDSCQGVTMQML